MNSTQSRCRGHRFPPEIIGYAVWVYHRFCLSFRDVEDLLGERGITVSYEAIRRWCRKFGPDYARRLKKKQGRLVSGRTLRQNQRPATVSLACRGSGWGCHRYSAAV